MTSLIIFILTVTVVAAVTHQNSQTRLVHTVIFWPLFATFCLLAEDAIVTPVYNRASVNQQLDSNERYHTSRRRVIEGYINSSRWDEFPNLRRVEKAVIANVLLQLNGGTKESTINAYDNLGCYLNAFFNKHDSHSVAVRCFTYDHLGNKVDPGIARMWESILIDGTSSMKEVSFEVQLKPSIIEAAHADWEDFWEKRAELSVYNAKQAEKREACLSTWSTSSESSLRGLHYYCKKKYPDYSSHEEMVKAAKR